MNFVKKIASSIRSLFFKKTASATQKNDKIKSEDLEVTGDSKFLAYLKKTLAFLYKYSKKLVIFTLGLINTMMKPMVKISKKHPIAFWAAVILHAALLFGLLYANVERWEAPQQASAVSQAAPVQAVMIDMEIIEAEQDRLKDVEKQKQQKLKNEEKRSETAKKDQKVAEQEALKAKAQKVFAEVKRKAEEEKTKEAEILASKAVEKIAEAETKTKAEELKAKEAEAKRIAEEAKTKEAEIQVLEAEKQKATAEALRKAEEVKTKLAELKRKAEEEKTKEAETLAKEAAKEAQESELLAKEAELLAKKAEEKRIEEELKAKDAVKEAEKLAEEKARDAEILAQEVAKQVKEAEKKRKVEEEKAREAEDKRILEELKLKEAESQRMAEEIKIKEAAVILKAAQAKTKEAEALVDEASKNLEKEQQSKNILEEEISALKSASEKIKYQRLLEQEVQDEQDLARSLIIEDQLQTLKSAWIANMKARILTFWRYQGSEDDWSCSVYVLQNKEGEVQAVNIRSCETDGSDRARSFKNSIERAVYKASPLPAAPDEAVYDSEFIFTFSVN